MKISQFSSIFSLFLLVSVHLSFSWNNNSTTTPKISLNSNQFSFLLPSIPFARHHRENALFAHTVRAARFGRSPVSSMGIHKNRPKNNLIRSILCVARTTLIHSFLFKFNRLSLSLWAHSTRYMYCVQYRWTTANEIEMFSLLQFKKQ